MTYSKVRIKFSNLQVFWYFYFVGWGKTGPAHSSPPPPPPPPFKMFRFFYLLFSLSVHVTLWLYLNILNDQFQREIKLVNQQVNWYFYIVVWGKTGPAHSFPPPKWFDHSIYLSVFWIMLLNHCIWTLLNILFQRENQVFKPNNLFVLLHCGVGKDWVGPFFPPSKMSQSFFLSFQSFGLCNSLNVSKHFWMTNSKVRIKFSNQQVYWYFYIVGWGKTGPAHSFPPPKCFDLPIYHLVFWLMLLLNCTWTI